MSERDQPDRVLIVEDDLANRELMAMLLGDEGYDAETACDGEEAWLRLESEGPRIDTVLLDWLLPGMTGLELLRRMKRDPRLQAIPVVLTTALTDRKVMLDAIAAGAFYYITKPIDRDTLNAVVQAATDDHHRYRSLQEALRRGIDAVATLDRAVFHYRDIDQAAALANLLSQTCPDPARTVVGLGELLVNAVEHGNLGITYDEKTRLLADGSWRQEVERRLGLAENLDKRVEVVFDRSPTTISISIMDQGTGFDWERFLVVSPDRMLHSHGRGIAMARGMSFHRLEYEPPGNRVTAFIDGAGPGDPAAQQPGGAAGEAGRGHSE